VPANVQFFQIRRRRKASINITPLIDIVFQLLIFFVVTTTFRAHVPLAVQLELPEAKTAEELGKQQIERLEIKIGPDETIYVNDKPVAAEKLADTFSAAKRKNPNVLLQLSADKRVSYGTIVTVMDAARDAGIRNVTAFTKRSVT
jgi:biopolymer transport protein ExbD